MARVVGYRKIKTKKGDTAYLVSYTEPFRAGTDGEGLDANTQYVGQEMFENTFKGVSPEKIVGCDVGMSYQRGTTFLESLTLQGAK